MPDISIPNDLLQAAAERANQEQRSLHDVINTLLRDYAAGRTWLNLPDGEQAASDG
jgi:metal-responsive CopG/Arc/MetJ family transcriptional regulator